MEHYEPPSLSILGDATSYSDLIGAARTNMHTPPNRCAGPTLVPNLVSPAQFTGAAAQGFFMAPVFVQDAADQLT